MRRAPGAVRGGIARDSPTVLFGGARRRRRPAPWLGATLLLAVLGVGLVLSDLVTARTPPPDGRARFAPPPPPDDGQGYPPEPLPVIEWKASKARGRPWSGRLAGGVQLPAWGPDWFTWDPILDVQPNRGWRRWATDALLRTLLRVLREYREANPDAPRVGVGDLSRPRGGWFGPEYGGLGHASHQNGLDVDVFWPRRDGAERRARVPSQVDRRLAQDLVDRFLEAGAEKLFVGPGLRLRGPRGIVVPLVHHDDHLHARIPQPPG